jgi:hypothetical protein
MVRCVMKWNRKKCSKGKKLAVDMAPACKSRPQSLGATLLFLALHNTLSFIRQMSVVSGEDGNHAQMTTVSFALRLYTHLARRHALATPNPAANRCWCAFITLGHCTHIAWIMITTVNRPSEVVHKRRYILSAAWGISRPNPNRYSNLFGSRHSDRGGTVSRSTPT